MVSKERYGPWALIVGGSEGIGEQFARKLGAAGIHLVLVARKPAPLLETAQKVRDESGVEVRTLQLDIARDDMLDRIREVTDDVEIGLVIHNVGGGQGSGPFVEKTLDEVLATVMINPVAQTKLAHHFGRGMAERGRGGILLVGSMAGNAGSFHFATYSASKAFSQILAEALWAELQPKGVDVLALVIGATDTPARARSGVVDADEMPVASAEDIARQGLEQLPHGPVHVPPENVEFFNAVCAMPRREAAEMLRNLMTRMSPA
ncbi:MAG: SDR family NAD(P)-dependent oxidoreductase [Rhizomicrobium sp.]